MRISNTFCIVCMYCILLLLVILGDSMLRQVFFSLLSLIRGSSTIIDHFFHEVGAVYCVYDDGDFLMTVTFPDHVCETYKLNPSSILLLNVFFIFKSKFDKVTRDVASSQMSSVDLLIIQETYWLEPSPSHTDSVFQLLKDINFFTIVLTKPHWPKHDKVEQIPKRITANQQIKQLVHDYHHNQTKQNMTKMIHVVDIYNSTYNCERNEFDETHFQCGAEPAAPKKIEGLKSPKSYDCNDECNKNTMKKICEKLMSVDDYRHVGYKFDVMCSLINRKLFYNTTDNEE